MNSKEATEFLELGLKELTPATDVYSIGAVILKCLVGAAPDIEFSSAILQNKIDVNSDNY